MIENSKNTLLTMIVLAALACGAAVLLIKLQEHVMVEKPLTGVDLYVKTCGMQSVKNESCESMGAIKAAFGFDLMAEINAQYQKMKKTASDIAAGSLTDEAYKACLKADTCAEVPMLDERQKMETSRVKEISRTFWELADGHAVTPGICKIMPLCSTALQGGVVTVHKNKINIIKAKRP